jgi:hypothetical protein
MKKCGTQGAEQRTAELTNGEVYHPGYGNKRQGRAMTRGAARQLLIASSAALALSGGVATFAPVELLNRLGVTATGPVVIIVQLLGALYLAFAMTNWTAKGAPIGGIYSRPISLGNQLHFTVGAIALGKYAGTHGGTPVLLVLLATYAVFAVGFWLLIFGRVE